MWEFLFLFEADSIDSILDLIPFSSLANKYRAKHQLLTLWKKYRLVDTTNELQPLLLRLDSFILNHPHLSPPPPDTPRENCMDEQK